MDQVGHANGDRPFAWLTSVLDRQAKALMTG